MLTKWWWGSSFRWQKYTSRTFSVLFRMKATASQRSRYTVSSTNSNSRILSRSPVTCILVKPYLVHNPPIWISRNLSLSNYNLANVKRERERAWRARVPLAQTHMLLVQSRQITIYVAHNILCTRWFEFNISMDTSIYLGEYVTYRIPQSSSPIDMPVYLLRSCPR